VKVLTTNTSYSKLVSKIHVTDKVLALLTRVAPGHGGTHWTHLETAMGMIKMDDYNRREGRELKQLTTDSLELAWCLLTCAKSPEQSKFC